MNLDPNNVEALVGAAQVKCAILFTPDMVERLSVAEAVLIKALSIAPSHAMSHLMLGVVYMFTKRSDRGIAECKRGLSLDRNLATAHAFVGFGCYTLGRAEETETHILEALRISPRDTLAYRWMMFAGYAKLLLNQNADALVWFRRSLEANRNLPIVYFHLGASLALLDELEPAKAAVKAGLVLHPSFTVHAYRSNVLSDNPTYLAGREHVYEGMRMAGVPEK